VLDPPLEEEELVEPLLEELEPPLEEELDPPLDEVDPLLELPPELEELPPSAGSVKVCPPHAPRATTATMNPSSRRISDLPIQPAPQQLGCQSGFCILSRTWGEPCCADPVRGPSCSSRCG
jgi:hypothetical protein